MGIHFLFFGKSDNSFGKTVLDSLDLFRADLIILLGRLFLDSLDRFRANLIIILGRLFLDSFDYLRADWEI